MAKNLYITAVEARTGKSVVALGVMEMLVRNIDRVAFFRPIISKPNNPEGKDHELLFLADYYKLGTDYQEMFAYDLEEATDLVSHGKQEELMEGILEAYNRLAAHHDFVLCLGTDFESLTTNFEADINMTIASNLAAPVLLVMSGKDKGLAEIQEAAELALDTFESKKCQVIALMLNRVAEASKERLVEGIKTELGRRLSLVYAMPEDELLASVTVNEVARHLNAEILYGQDQLSRPVKQYAVGAMKLRNFLERISEDSLVLAPSDRLDIILGSIGANVSTAIPHISGILLTESIQTPEVLYKLMEGMPSLVPILRVREDTFQTVTKLNDIHTLIGIKDQRKIATALANFQRSVVMEELRDSIIGYCSTLVTPKMFQFGLIKRAAAAKKTIVLPEGTDERILKAAEFLIHRKVVEVVLLGEVTEVKAKIKALGLELKGVPIIDPGKDAHYPEYVDCYMELRKHKGITRDYAEEAMLDVSYFGTMMVHFGHADGMVSGAAHSTMHTIRPSFEIIKTKPGFSIVSSVFFMCLEDRVLVYGDCAVNPNPSAEELAVIAISAAETAQAFGIEPRIAMLSYSTGESGKGQDVDKVREATRIAHEREPSLKIEGPIQYDAAVDMGVAKTKLPGSEVAGRATIFIFPDLNTGNNTYKAVQRSANALAIGPVMQGMNKPVNDLSRGCTVADIINTIAITAIQAG